MRTWAPAALLCLAACSPGGGTPAARDTASPSAPATTPAAATTPPAKPTARATPSATAATPRPTATATPRTDLADGHQVGYFTAISAGKRTLTVDVAQWLEGAAAERAWAEDGNTEELPYSFYIRNQSTRVRTLAFAPGMTITVNTLASEETGSASDDTSVSVATFDGYFPSAIRGHPFHFTLTHGVVTDIKEQYLP